jgi:putative Holliday junction resolvase
VNRIAFDLGARRVGVSLHDDDDIPARPHGTLTADERLIETLSSAVLAHHAEEVVIGLPLTLDGTEGPAARRARRVAAALRRRVPVPVVLWDERLTTVQAARARRARGVKGREGLDAEAAAILLQSYVDARIAAARRDGNR